VVRRFGWKGLIVVAVLGVGFYFLAPDSAKQALLGGGPSSGSVCDASPENTRACDFSSVVLASTEDVWQVQFRDGRLPSYAGQAPPSAYALPTLVVFGRSVQTGCGNASSDVGPFYCPADGQLYIDPSFYAVMERQLGAPGDFAQAYVIAHEVGHHVQNLIGATRMRVPGESEAQISVRVELQADCFAGVWGHSARSTLQIDDSDLAEALNAAHAIGDDTLGHQNTRDHTHGSSEQRQRWFQSGFSSGDPRQCDTFAVGDHAQL
jgi:hypothetical protein